MSVNQFPPGALGPLESEVMERVWQKGDCNVRQMVERLPQALAYTTVMTTLDRLYKKGLLERRKHQRAFVYSARVSHAQWLRRQAGEFLAGFFGGSVPERTAVLSCLLEAVEAYDAELLEELNRQIREKQRQLTARSAE
ncbi:MAG: BlaI/MecI/CopY family transcriptional regulator [Acidobacteria bacterium]|nr:MAG: BlaI/MecI/CopY family transcriptional regulator [Acidobacteriota bacterium]